MMLAMIEILGLRDNGRAPAADTWISTMSSLDCLRYVVCERITKRLHSSCGSQISH